MDGRWGGWVVMMVGGVRGVGGMFEGCRLGVLPSMWMSAGEHSGEQAGLAQQHAAQVGAAQQLTRHDAGWEGAHAPAQVAGRQTLHN